MRQLTPLSVSCWISNCVPVTTIQFTISMVDDPISNYLWSIMNNMINNKLKSHSIWLGRPVDVVRCRIQHWELIERCPVMSHWVDASDVVHGGAVDVWLLPSYENARFFDGGLGMTTGSFKLGAQSALLLLSTLAGLPKIDNDNLQQYPSSPSSSSRHLKWQQRPPTFDFITFARRRHNHCN